jgi:hypothetical protein
VEVVQDIEVQLLLPQKKEPQEVFQVFQQLHQLVVGAGLFQILELVMLIQVDQVVVEEVVVHQEMETLLQ